MDCQRNNTLNKTFLILTVLALGVTACNKKADAPKGEGTVCYFNLSASIGGEGSSKGVSLGASTASIPASDGFIVTCSDVTNSGDGTYTWTYTVTRCA